MITELSIVNLENGRKIEDVAVDVTVVRDGPVWLNNKHMALMFYGVRTVVVIKMMIRQPRAI